MGIIPWLCVYGAPLGSETSLDRDTQPVFPTDMKQQLEGRQKPTEKMVTEGKLSPGTWTVKILDNRVINGHNPVNTTQPLYNFTMNGVTYIFDPTKVADPALLLKTAVTIQTQGSGGLNLSDPATLAAVKQLEQMSNGTLRITQSSQKQDPAPVPPSPPVSCTPTTFILNGNTGTWIFINLSAMPGSCSVGVAPGTVVIGVQNPHTSCTDSGTKLFFDILPAGALVSTSIGFSKYTGMCGSNINSINASSINNQVVVQSGGKKYVLKFSVSNGGLQPIPYSHFGRYNSITIYNVSATEQP